MEREVEIGLESSEDFKRFLYFLDPSNENAIVRVPAIETQVAPCLDLENERLND